MTDKNDDIDFSMVLASSVHDMKNSVGMLLASLEGVIEETPPTSPAQAHRFSTLHYEASRINSELIQLLTIYRMQNDFLPVRIDEHFVFDVIEDQVARNHILLETKGINLDIECDDTLSWYFDQDLIGSVLHNVIVNCARYTKSAILVTAMIEDEMLAMTVEDNGPGYPDAMLRRPAGQINDSLVNEGQTHLGLFFADKIASFHKQSNRCGYIQLNNESKLGGGCFKLVIP
ncbi:HAMP domain-containing sensor histidine kinase [Teredinibacter sp. KSP-S5-2]|uniref:sensor histidine kinase n=1 Tax=Teredinibacter sp. KSP-S5-2 TaxID=3034506 RepID=UPI0029347A67|nr:HAMP domain-containing sensor histidine kinase [Teredinibacter sp. KSP-S5-2]WNO07721.1 HAMP domain-containing sensor histidine kinase [Teredinibacter sp. KSP-S5-2]